MTIDFLIYAAVLALFSVVQSIFGMGILVFGTPTLLLLGNGFEETLGLLLPSSLAISLCQVIFHAGGRPPISKSLLVFCLPSIGIGLYLVVSADFNRDIYLLVAGALALAAGTRVSNNFREFLRRLIAKQLILYHIAMGLLHGLTNLGGALLGILTATVYKRKEQSRYVTAFYYAGFVLLQILLLAALGKGGQLLAGTYYIPVTLLIYFFVGNRLFKSLAIERFQNGMTLFLVMYAAVLTFKWSTL